MLRLLMLGIVILLGLGNLQADVPGTQISISNHAGIDLTESAKVDRLIQFVRSMKDATFIRNGRSHSCQEAAAHLQSKWEKHKEEIRSAKAFIEKLASKSGMSREPYKIRFRDGSEQTTSAVLLQELKRLENL